MKLPVHRWFRYSAGFSAEWAEQVIKEYSPAAVLDPFAGSGTTLLAAEAAGAKAYGFESHPFVARIAEAKIHWDHDPRRLLECADRILMASVNARPVPEGDIPELMKKCYSPEVMQKLYALQQAYFICSSDFDVEVSRLLWLAITAILRPCSHVGTAQWQYVLPNKTKAKTLEPFFAFTQKVREMAADMAELSRKAVRSDSIVFQHDSRREQELIEPNSIDLVVTSPPYPNNYDYADATRLEMTFWNEVKSWGDLQVVVRQHIIRSCSQHSTAERLKLDELLGDASVDAIRTELSAVCNELAEVRLTKGGKKAYHTMVAAYFYDLSRVLQGLRKVCKPGSTMCFVVGDSAPYGVYVPADVWLGELARAAGFESYSFEKLRDRNVKWKNRKHQVPLHEGRLWIRG
ncbi:DNA modification methylase [Pseudomonas sp. ATCC 13867]|nr:DNA modification methylase [Pseudomonas sp. ATCC 13867]